MLLSKKMPLAIKTCKEGIDEIKKKQFLEEAEIMKPYNHPNVVRLIGICNEKDPFMICKYMTPGLFIVLFSTRKWTGTYTINS